MPKPVIFAGPSVPNADRVAFPMMDFRPPVSGGDLFALQGEAIDVVGLIDGLFGDRPAIGHKEILWLMAQGVRVIGGASMGALRAAELDVYGMEGVGAIYRSYRSGSLRDDADVAVSHGPAYVSFQATSIARVDVDATLAALAARKRLSPTELTHIATVSNGIHFARRTWESIAQQASTDDPQGLLRLLKSAHVERKRLDALAVLAAVRTATPNGAEPPAFSPPRTITFRQQMARYLKG